MDELNQYLLGVRDGKQEIIKFLSERLVKVFASEEDARLGKVLSYEIFATDWEEVLSKVKEHPSSN